MPITIQTPEFTLLYDGSCPICQKEVAWLWQLNKQGKLFLQDINAPEFNPELYQTSYTSFMAEIHGYSADRKLIKGMPVFRSAYKAVGLGWLLAPTGWPILKPVFDRMYLLFAQHRIKLGQLLFNGSKQCQRCKIQNEGDKS